MDKQTLYVSDNFFSAGRTDVYNGLKEKVGEVDLRSMFTAGLDVLNKEGEIIVSGKFPFLSRRWIVTGSDGQEIGNLRAKFALFSRRYQYNTEAGRVFEIESEAFSNLYLLYDENGNEAGRFEKISGFFSAAAFQLTSSDEGLDVYEMIAVVMGVNAIQKAARSARNAAH
ncbi:hypothetical protein DRW41_07700 [Neobacillus piezotolerans]|uniref:Uncharacterized protein n=1 Tax=Neobacillus piezotolerans TaxID=2259171 RepID=A0A3D8GTD5_9BACI|nr:hypothetical protein [Neobacillus piezotolerans]RDU37708.1 hypothetical protein DRW41_07700 [Neobacillus piezotolerans]